MSGCARAFGAQAVVHNGKHGNLEWLPGKALALSSACYPEARLGRCPTSIPSSSTIPARAARPSGAPAAVIVDHLTPPLTRAESYGPLKDLEALVDEYYSAAGLDRAAGLLRREILDLSARLGLDIDAGIDPADDAALHQLDAYICDLKERRSATACMSWAPHPKAARDRPAGRAARLRGDWARVPTPR
jgi:cobaltochelatase CobN